MAELADRKVRQVAPRRWLAVEFAAFYLVAPVAGAVLLPANAMFGMLFAMTVLGLVLLNRTPGFHWRDIARGWGRVDWHRVAVVGAVTAVGGYGVVLVSAPDSAFALLREHPGFMLAILVLYPVLSALPQEIVFRVLFFRRYGEILPRGPAAIGLNAAVFALAHLMYWNWIVGVMTFVGGIAFAEAYLRRRSFATAVAAHAVAGDLVFLIGLGIYFYSGYVVRPF